MGTNHPRGRLTRILLGWVFGKRAPAANSSGLSFRYRMAFLGNYRPQNRGKTMKIVRVCTRTYKNSAQKLNLKTLSSLKNKISKKM